MPTTVVSFYVLAAGCRRLYNTIASPVLHARWHLIHNAIPTIQDPVRTSSDGQESRDGWEKIAWE